MNSSKRRVGWALVKPSIQDFFILLSFIEWVQPDVLLAKRILCAYPTTH
ncbi:hypothetical protein MGMO_71c00050 [Methyloglobulus morosus KoM1]|uniref:Uncharacterized protein n=1 Tax=Methyloglobulus morosus KoM1 TaxID=1116472 RepID=V5C5T5_9GAMM|nr:hypothetical protein MGMO_71c00050 [Methyloglobulus morosus KoM1]